MGMLKLALANSIPIAWAWASKQVHIFNSKSPPKCVHARILIADNQPVPFASPAKLSTGGLCSASKDKQWLPVKTSLSPTESSACVASSSYIHNNFSDMAAAQLTYRPPLHCTYVIVLARFLFGNPATNIFLPQNPINVGMERGVAIIEA